MAQLIVIGLATGSIYIIISLAMTLLINGAGVVNFATGDVMMFGAYVFLTFSSILKTPWYLAYPLSMLSMALFGLIFERTIYHPLRKAGVITIMIATMAFGIVVRNIAQFIWGAIPYSVAGPFGMQVIHLADVTILLQDALIVVVMILLLSIQLIIFEKTDLGRQLRALAQDKVAAELMGIKVDRLISFTFVYTAVLCGIAGMLFAPIFFVNPNMGGSATLKAFAAIVVGGWGNVPGAIVGALTIGVMETLLSGYLSTTYKDAYAFIILIAFLLFRPQGILGQRISEKV